jgi:hypothetical protein
MCRLRTILLVCALLAGASAVHSQDRDRAIVRLEQIELNSVPTPNYKAISHPKAKREYEWLQVYTQYTASGGEDGWLDELEIQWSVLIHVGEGRYLLLNETASYVDIEAQGAEHHAVVYVRPSVARRYYGKDRISKSDVWVHAEVLVGGRVIAKEDYGRTRPPGERWWQTRNSRIKVVEGGLLTRDKTPFAPLDYDFYDHLKDSPGR